MGSIFSNDSPQPQDSPRQTSNPLNVSEKLLEDLERDLGGQDGQSALQALLQILAQSSAECFAAFQDSSLEAAAVIVCGDPVDLTAPERAAQAVVESKAKVLVISGGAGKGGTKDLFERAKKKFGDLEFDVPGRQSGREPVPEGKSSPGKPMDEETANSYITEADIYLAIVRQQLIKRYNFEDLQDIEIRYNQRVELPPDNGKKLQIVIENRSTHSGENAEFCEKLLDFSKQPSEKPRVIFVKAPLLLLRGVLTMKKAKGEVEQSEWLGQAKVIAYAEPCPELAKCSPLERLEAVAQAAGEFARIKKYDTVHLDTKSMEDGPRIFAKAGILIEQETELQRLLKEAGGLQGCGTN